MRFRFLIYIFHCLLVNWAYAQSNIIVQGTWENGAESLSLFYSEDATTFKPTWFTSKVDSLTGKFNFMVPANHPTMLQLLDNFFLAFPGDTVEFEVNGTGRNAILNFLGPKGMDYGFFSRLKEEVGQFKLDNFSFDQSASVDEYKKEATAHFNATLDFYKDYFSKNGGVSNHDTLVKDLLTVSYYRNLLYPLISCKIIKDRLPMNYFDQVNTSLFEKSELLPFREFILLLSYVNDCFYSLPTPKDKYYDSAYVADNISSARSNFKGEIKNNLLLFIFINLAENGHENNKRQIEELYTFLNIVFKDDSTRIEQIHESKLHFDIVNKPFPKEVLAQRLKTINEKYVTWGEVLSSDKVMYVDFWASYCAPCIAEMPNESKLISEFRDKGIEFIFISLDQDEEHWKKAMNKINIEGNHYLISENFKSSLIKYISFGGIPRYLIINKKILLSRDAPRPGFILSNKSIFLSLLK